MDRSRCRLVFETGWAWEYVGELPYPVFCLLTKYLNENWTLRDWLEGIAGAERKKSRGSREVLTGRKLLDAAANLPLDEKSARAAGVKELKDFHPGLPSAMAESQRLFGKGKKRRG